MGLVRATGATYLNIVEGKVVQRVKTKTPTSRTRVNKENKTVEEEVFKLVSGHLTGLQKTTHEKYGDTLCIYVTDEGKTYCLQCSFDGQYGVSFLKQLPNVDLSFPIELVPSEKVVNDKKKQTLYIKQHDKALKWAFTKDEPNGMPEPQLIEGKRGQEEWNYWPIVKFLIKQVFEPMRDKLSNTTPMPEGEPGEAVEHRDDTGEEKAGKDDLPF